MASIRKINPPFRAEHVGSFLRPEKLLKARDAAGMEHRDQMAESADFLTGKFTGGRTDAIRREGMEFFRRNHVAIYGTPDSVVQQIEELYEKIGGFGHLIAMLHAGDMDFDTTAKSMTLFAREVMPRLRDLGTRSKGFGPLAHRDAGNIARDATHTG